jgi:branched-subunit amino acid transport protein
MRPNIYLYIFVMAFATWCMRVIPSLVMKRPIKNQFAQSFLYYVPYVTLAVMTFPAIVQATEQPLAGAAALIIGILAAWFGASLINVAIACCVTVFVLELIMGML